MTNNIITPASRRRRFAAFLIDHIIIALMIITIAFLIGKTGLKGYNEIFSKRFLLIYVLLAGGIILLFKDIIKGISIGKLCMRIRVSKKKDGSTPTIIQLLSRNLFFILGPLEYVAIWAHDEKKRFGDMATQTLVVKSNKPLFGRPRIIALASMGLLFALFSISIISTIVTFKQGFEVVNEFITNNKEIIEVTGGIESVEKINIRKVFFTFDECIFSLLVDVGGMDKDKDVIVRLQKTKGENWMVIQMKILD
ncbi:RDD family protein [bacterium]|nr:RDD family protein [bacterium]